MNIFVSSETIIDYFPCFYKVEDFICNFENFFSFDMEYDIDIEFCRFLTILNFAIDHSKFLEDPRNLVCTAVPKFNYDSGYRISGFTTEYLVIAKVNNNGVTRVYSSSPDYFFFYNYNNDDFISEDDKPTHHLVEKITKKDVMKIIINIIQHKFITEERGTPQTLFDFPDEVIEKPPIIRNDTVPKKKNKKENKK